MNNKRTHKLTNSQKHKRYYMGVGLMLLFFIIAGIIQYNYSYSSEKNLEIQNFQNILNKKIRDADVELKEIQTSIEKNDTTLNTIAHRDDISFYIYANDSLRFWTENEIGIPNLYQNFDSKTAFVEFQHSDCIYRTLNYKNYHFVALIHIKNNYTEPNDYLKNDFVADYNMDNRVQIRLGSKKDKEAIFSPEKKYLFTLYKENIEVYNKSLSLWSMSFWILGLCVFYALCKNIYILQNKKRPSLKDFGFSFLGLSLLIYMGFVWNEPWMIFSQDFFSPIYYASNKILNSMGNLAIVSAFLLAEIIFLYQRVILPQFLFNSKQIKLVAPVLNLFSAGFFVFICWLFNSVIYNSSFEITLYKLENISYLSIIAVFLIISWLIGFLLLRLKGLQFLKNQTNLYNNFKSNLFLTLLVSALCFNIIKDYYQVPLWYLIISTVIDYIHYRNHKKITLSNLASLLVLCTCFIVHFSVTHSNLKLIDKYRALAENINSGEIMDRNLFSEILFEEMNDELHNDNKLLEISNKEDNAGSQMQSYLMKNYFRGYWSNYDIKTYVFNGKNPTKNDLERKAFYTNLLINAERVKKTSFYFCTSQTSKIDYIGIFDLHNETLYIEFNSKLRSTSYSYPEPLLNANKSSTYNNTLSIARYQNNKISSQIGEYQFPSTLNWIQKSKDNFYSFVQQDYIYYIYRVNGNSTIVLGQAKTSGYYIYIVFFAYLLTLYFIILFIIYGLFRLRRQQYNQQTSFLSRLQTSFVLLMIISFLSIFIISVNYIIRQYENKQNNELQNKTRYIQKYIQGSLKQYNDLKQANVVDLNFFLQDLSNTYETDIHIYDNKGFLVASSQPIIFAKGLISYRISPTPFFEDKKEFTQTEHIGKLNYLSAYTKIYNDKNQLLGYIAVPSFLSSDEIQKQIFSLLAVIINVYLFIIFIATLLSFLVNNQLSKPIKALEDKLKAISLKGYNEKLEYTHNDEIGRLVAQYNLMVDKLEKSANKLAQSEREVAWKQMARQITHEINNPLTPMKLTIQQLQRMKEMDSEQFDEYFKKSAQMLIEQIENLSRIASSFSDFAKMPEAKQERVNITARLESVVNLFKNNNEAVEINFKAHPNELFVLADKEQLTQIFNNLIKNAIQAIPSDRKGLISITTVVKENIVRVEIKDNGMGISKEAEDLLFAPNFTTKSSGMGLGLAIVKNIVEGSGGKIWFKTKADVGSSFFLEFPLC